MTECPECMATFKGNKCACGYTPPRVAYFTEKATREEAVASEQARQWLEHHGIHKPGMTRKEKTAASIAYMKRIKSMPKPESNAWAFEIISRIADGEIVTAHAEACAREVARVPKDQREAA